MDEIRCFECNKMFATVNGGNIYVAPSTSIEFDEDILQIEIKCPRCKKLTTVSLST